ncbi:cupin domain-containing protein [Pontibacter qinzhouensis]|uniref:Cupin domain-containing protein n=1 Tax=Pontibacter qinzhouensis TaxID=2603253 RepID=A0A5C8J5W8_9BACT|nr:cupin domain-containing protein [Pontibacter qinzhouensis]TXK33280.1 cupin domain-containing protein [Pontibacter qinzhouensis]
MENKAENMPPANTDANHAFEAPLLTFNLPSLILQAKGEEQWEKSGRIAKTLYKSKSRRIVLNVMQAGTEIKLHQAPGPISVQVLEGHLGFHTEAASVMLRQGEMLTLKEHTKHRVEALDEAAFLLTVAPLEA